MSDDRTTLVIDGREYRVPEGMESGNLLEVCLSLGLDLPYFCWHPALGSVGACRQCAVQQYEDEGDDRGELVMACMTPVEDGARISLEAPGARDFRARVIEWLMVNHPHDCPVCDEGGECHLQDMTVMTGHAYRRFRFDKRTHRNQDLGPFIEHEMNRCIACYRCVRFYRDHAGGRDLHALGSHHNVYFGRHQDGALESEFAGNLVEVCPTGVFTDKTLKRYYTRKWDLTSAPSVCVHCGVGCNTLAGERYGSLRRILNRYHGEVNGYFLCDRGRFGYEFVHREDRVRSVLVRAGTEEGERRLRPLEPEKGTDLADHLLALLGPEDPEGSSGEGRRIWGIGSPRASLEANFALKTLVGPERFSTGLAGHEHGLARTAVELLSRGPLPTPSLEQVRRSDAVLVLGEDPSDTAPVLALALRQAARRAPLSISRAQGIPDWHDAAVREAIQDRTGPFFLATPAATRLDDLATETLRAGPGEIARLGSAVARALHPEAPEAPEPTDQSDDGRAGHLRELAGRIAEALREAERPVVVSGTGAGSQAVMEAAADVVTALARISEEDGSRVRPSGLVLTVPECNSAGLSLLGGRPLEEAFEAVQAGEADAVVVLENDLFRRAEAGRVEAFLDACREGGPALVVIDHLLHPTARAAHLVLPAATFAEGDGTYVSSEGRAQRAFQVHEPLSEEGHGPGIQESWRWLGELAEATGRSTKRFGDLPWKSLDEAVATLAGSDPVFELLPEVAPGAGFRQPGGRVPRQPARYSGRTAEKAHRTVHEPKPAADPDAPMSYSMEGTRLQPPPALQPRYWAPGWNSVQALNRFQDEVGGALRGGDPGKRLLEPPPDADPASVPYLGPAPEEVHGVSLADGASSGEGSGGRPTLLVVPLPQVFGSEELSAKARGVARRIPEPRWSLHPEDAAALGHLLGPVRSEGETPGEEVREGALLEIRLPGGPVTLPVRLREDLPRGVAGFPAGLPGVPYRRLPARGEVLRALSPADRQSGNGEGTGESESAEGERGGGGE